MSDGIRKIPLYRALNRPDLLAGCERELFLGVALIVVLLTAGAMNLVSGMIGLVFWFFCIGVLRRMAKADPWMSKVYRRHVGYDDFYQAHSTPFARVVDYKKKKWGGS